LPSRGGVDARRDRRLLRVYDDAGAAGVVERGGAGSALAAARLFAFAFQKLLTPASEAVLASR
jgi:hypothetical protein